MDTVKKWTLLALTLSTLLLSACGGGGGGDDDDDDEGLANLYAYKANSPYSDVLVKCVRAEEAEDTCSFGELPLLGMESSNPSIDDIMNRVTVSHAWMGERFEEILTIMPAELLQLFQSITMIAIDDDIRPSYYTTRSAAIYLDPAFLWLTVSEARTINTKEDFRAGFDDELQFMTLNRYADGFAYAYGYIAPQNASESRELSDIRYLIANLLLHELAHANDFLPSTEFNNLELSDRPFEAIDRIVSSFVSSDLYDTVPLTSQEMHDLGQVMFRGEEASNRQKSFTSADVAGFYAPDGAADDYAYSSRYEDVAMLFEEVMMKRLFDLERDYAITPQSDNCAGAVVSWGLRNRIAAPQVKNRARIVVEGILPNQNFDEFFENLGEPMYMKNGISWCDAIYYPSASSNKNAQALNLKSNSHYDDKQLLLDTRKPHSP